MLLTEVYALSTGLKIGQPYIQEQYFALDFDKYIVIHPYSKPAKTYNYWNDVIEIIKPELDKQGIKIVQIGAKGEKPLSDCINIQGLTTINQAAYVIKNSLLLVGADSFSAHIGGHYDKKMVTLYSNSNPENCAPYWGNKQNQISLIGDRQGKKASYALDENPKTINTIKPETIAEKILGLLNLPYTYEYETVYIGSEYKNDHVIIFPCSSCVEHHPNSVPELRMDLEFNEEVLAQQLSKGRAYVVTDKPISIELLKKFKTQIVAVVYLITENDSPEFIKAVKKLGIQIHVFTHLPSEKFQPKKIIYYDLIRVNEITQPNAQVIESLRNKGFYYKSRQSIYSNEKMFHSKAAFFARQDSKEKVNSCIESDDFWNQLEDFRILKKKNGNSN